MKYSNNVEIYELKSDLKGKAYYYKDSQTLTIHFEKDMKFTKILSPFQMYHLFNFNHLNLQKPLISLCVTFF